MIFLPVLIYAGHHGERILWSFFGGGGVRHLKGTKELGVGVRGKCG